VAAAPTIRLDGAFVLDGWRAEDAASHRAFAEDAAAARFFGWTVEEARAQPDVHYTDVIKRFQDEWMSGSRFSLAIRRVATGDAVGAVELRPADDAVEVSYVVTPAFRGRGLAPRALSALLDWAARELSVSRALLSCHVENVASQRVAEKCGFTLAKRDGDQLLFIRRLASGSSSRHHPAVDPVTR
jgi:[ribosomal protein S5]-alanine N-acetyltransferase